MTGVAVLRECQACGNRTSGVTCAVFARSPHQGKHAGNGRFWRLCTGAETWPGMCRAWATTRWDKQDWYRKLYGGRHVD